MALLIVEHGPYAGTAFPLDAPEVTLGRSPTNHIVLDLPTISREHARIRQEGDTYVLEDLQSTNGTFLNDEPVTQRPLHEGDHIRLGPATLRFTETVKPATEPALELVASEGQTDTAAVLARVDAERYPVLATDNRLGLAAEERIAFVSHLSTELLQLLDPDELAGRVADRLFEVFPDAEQVLLAFTEEGTGTLVPRASRRRTGQGDRGVTLSQTILRTVTEERAGVLCADVQEDIRFRDRPSVVGARIRSFLCVPLVCRDEFLGLIYIDTGRVDTPFQRTDLLLATAIASQVALAASNIRLHRAAVARARLELDLSLAEKVQRSFLPAHTPDIPGMTFATYYTTAYEVGGDLYDFIPTANGRWLVVIGDVSGKGISAALLMARLTRDIRYHAVRNEPAQILSELSRSLAQETDGRVFATLLCLELQPEERRLTIASAGHCQPLVIPRSAPPFFFSEVTDFPLAVEPQEPHEQRTLTLAPGDCVFAYTDGLTEAMNEDGVIFGTDRLLRAATQAVSLGASGPEALLEHILLVLRAFRGDAAPTDDLTMLAFRWDAPA
jgi:sigma-B regulation protein RsbU (phosphoserine phosphatase)